MTETIKKEIVVNKTILRAPTREEIAEANTNPSDYQIAQLRILSKILKDFGLVSQVYRSKKATVQYNNQSRMKRYKKKFNAFFNEFKDAEQVANVRIILDMTEDNSSEQFLASDYVAIYKNILTNNNHSEEYIKSLVTDTYKSVKGIETLSKSNLIDIEYLSKDIFNIWLTHTFNGHTIESLNKAIIIGSSINQFMRDDEDMKKAANILYADTSIETVSELKEKMEQFIDENTHDGVYIHAMTYICDEANKNINKLSTDLKINGYVNGLTVANVMDYFKTYKPNIANTLLKEYGFYDVTNIKTWEDVANFFYTPEMIRKIELEKNRVINRPRSKSDKRKGHLLAIDKRSIDKRKKNLLKKIEDNNISISNGNKKCNIERAKKRLDLKEKEYAEARKKRDKTKANMKQALLDGNINLYNALSEIYNKEKAIVLKISKAVASIRHEIKRYTNVKESSGDIKKSDIDLMRELEAQEMDIINKAWNLDDDNQEVIENIVPHGTFFDPKEINYRTWSFIVNTVNPKIIKHILNQINETLPQATKGYFNVDAYEPENTEIVGNATEVIIDYPAESKLCKIFKKNKSAAYDFIDSMIYGVRRDLGIIITYNSDEVKINEAF